MAPEARRPLPTPPSGQGLAIERLAVRYGQHEALKGVDLHVAPGEIVVILGANGAGKTSLLKAVAGMIPCDAGSRVRMDGQVIAGLPPHRIVEAGLALVPEGRGIFGDLAVRENLALGGFAHRARAHAADNLERVLALFPRLAERSAQLARTMSGGEQQMVAIGRALMSAPTILMLDEPSLGLSPLLCVELFKTLVAIREAGVGILLVEQNARQSLAIADRAYLLENGEIVGAGTAEQLARDPAVQAAYLGGAAGHAVPLAAPVAGAVTAGAPSSASAAAELAAHALAAVAAPRAGVIGTPTMSADVLVPMRIADLVRVAARRQADDVIAQRGGVDKGAIAARALAELRDSGSLDAAAARIEAAAAAARAAPAAGTPAPPGIEIWRRPGVEVYRRQSDGTLRRED